MENIFQIKEEGQSHPIIIKKSKFIASAAPVNSEKEAKEFYERICAKEKRANHNCFAYRLKSFGVIYPKLFLIAIERTVALTVLINDILLYFFLYKHKKKKEASFFEASLTNLI